MKKRVLICGPRKWIRPVAVRKLVRDLIAQYGVDGFVIVEGEAKGVDRMAREAGEELGVEVERHPANWGRYGAAAGPLRNGEMLDSGIDVVHAIGYGRGTLDCTKQARSRGIPVIWRYSAHES